MQAAALIGFAVLATSTIACVLGANHLGLGRRALHRAGVRALRAVGMGVMFFGANLVLGVLAIAVVRTLTGRFLSPYNLSDISLLSLSLLQGLVFAWWLGCAGSDME